MERRFPGDGVPADYFEFFDLPRRLNIDAKDLEKRFYVLSRKWHPDVFARKSVKERDAALESSAILNDAYRTLKDPIARTHHLLKLEGLDIGEQGTKDVPPELLEEIFELNMALEDDPGYAPALESFLHMRASVDVELEDRFAVWDGTQDRAVLGELRSLLNRRKYISNLIDKTNVSDRI